MERFDRSKLHILFGMILVLLLAVPFLASAEGADISGYAFLNMDGNTSVSEYSQKMTGVPVELFRLSNENHWEKTGALLTDGEGAYSFSDLDEGEYRIVCSLLDYEFSPCSVNDSSSSCSGLLSSETITVSNGNVLSEVNILLVPSAHISVEAYQDSNSDGKIGKFERGLSEVRIEVLLDGQMIASGLTNAKGKLSIMVAPGEYTLRATPPNGFALTVLGDQSDFQGTDEAFSDSMLILFSAGENTKLYAACCSSGSLSGKVFEDVNNNGLMDEDEPGVAGTTLHIVGKNTGVKRSITTDETGLYQFIHLPNDTYTITADLPEGMLYAHYSKTGGDLRSIFTGSTVSRSFPVKKAASVTDKNVGLIQKGIISGIAFYDTNYNGIYDEGEPGYAGVTVEAIKISTGDSMGKTVTAKNGSYSIENLRAGDYRLRAILPDDGSIFSVTAQGTPDFANLFQQRSSRRENSISPLTIASGAEINAVIGVARGASISGTVFQDTDYNGYLNGSEKGISGIKVRLMDENGSETASTTTNRKGEYSFEGIMPGLYTLQVQRIEEYGFTRLRPEEHKGSWIASLKNGWGISVPMNIEMGEKYTDRNAGMLPSSTLSGIFFHDANDNGLKDVFEGGMPGASVRLYSEDAEIDLTEEIHEDGSFFFDGIMPGTYTVTYILPGNSEMARVVAGGNNVSGSESTAETQPFSIRSGEHAVCPTAGGVILGTFNGIVFHDINADGFMNDTETALSGASILLSADNGMEDLLLTTKEDGTFQASGLRPGNYTVTVTLPDGMIFSNPLDSESLHFDCLNTQQLSCPWKTLVNRTNKQIGAVIPALVSGEIWLDENRDGKQAENEAMLSDVKVELMNEYDGTVAQTVFSDENGFSFEKVRPGLYSIRFDLPDGCSLAADLDSTMRLDDDGKVIQTGVHLFEGTKETNIHTGIVAFTRVGGQILLDSNGESSPLPGVEISLFMDGQTIVLSTVKTDSEGRYEFDGLWPGLYRISAECKTGTVFIRQDDVNYSPGISVITEVKENRGYSEAFELKMYCHQMEKNIRSIIPAKVGDTAWLDENENGLLDGGEKMIPDITVKLLQNGNVVYETTTDAHGYYLFNEVYPGEYVLEADAYSQLTPTTSVPSLRIISSCLVSGDGTCAYSEPFRVESGTNNKDFDLGYVLLPGQKINLPDEPTKDWTNHNEKDVGKSVW